MFKLLKNQKGSLGIALVVAMIGILSGVSLSSVAFRDSRSNRLQLDALQKFHLLRSEVSRARIILSYHDIQGHIPQLVILPDRLTDVFFGKQRTVYNTKTRVETRSGGSANDSYIIRTLVTAFRGDRNEMNNQENRSPVSKYGENVIESLSTMAIFHYFTDVDEAIDGVPGNIRFFGQDEVHGRTHSNSDIWIRNAGGGSNDGWPTFTGLVTTSGTVKVYPGGGDNYPKNQIFRGGLIENYPRVQFEPSADLVRQNGRWVGGSQVTDDKIAFVTVDGAGYTLVVGDIRQRGSKEIKVYDSYPPYGEIGEHIGTNNVAMIDTVWSAPQSSSLVNASAFVPFELWISGDFGGRQTWAAAGNVYLKDDITLRGTQRGARPDDDNNPNPRDYVGIISEQSIFIQYGYMCPIEEVRKRPNTDNIYLYGAYLASGRGSGPNATFGDGIVTFQYQFPKGSTPDQEYWISPPCNTCPNATTGKVVSGSLNNGRNNVTARNLNNRRMIVNRDDDDDDDDDDEPSWLTMIDLHLNYYPTTVSRPWDRGIDYPWYNPLWPEPGNIYPQTTNEAYTGFTKTPVPPQYEADLPRNVLLRGVIHLYGSIAQRRRGFVRRSGNPDFDAGPTIPWDLEDQKFGINVGPSGYDKNYNFDKRFEKVGPPDFPLVKFEGSLTDDSIMDLGYRTISWYFKNPRANF